MQVQALATVTEEKKPSARFEGIKIMKGDHPLKGKSAFDC